MAPRLLALVVVAVASFLGCVRRQGLFDEASRARLLAHECRLRASRLDLVAERVRERLTRAELRAMLVSRLVLAKRARLRMMLRRLDAAQGRALAASARSRTDGQSGALEAVPAWRSSWHAVSPDGSCPAEVPQWEWRVLMQAAMAREAHSRADALDALRTSSRLPLAELKELAGRYAQVLTNPEFEGILDVAHPPCGGRRFAWLGGDRLLTIDCPRGGASYALDDEVELRGYNRPVRVAKGESILAFCGAELNLLAHPRFRPELMGGGAQAAADGWGARRSQDGWGMAVAAPAPEPPQRRVPSVLIFMIDATSRAHFRRSLPKTLAMLERLAEGGSDARGHTRSDHGPAWGDSDARADSGLPSDRLHVFDFEHFNIVGFNSLPNQLPLYCNTLPADLGSLQPGRCVWEAFKRRGAVTAMIDEERFTTILLYLTTILR